MGAALQQQQQSQQPQQSQQQAPQGDQIEALKQSLAQRATPQQGPTGGPIKRLLQNFIGGMGQSMMHEAGLPTEYEQQQKAIGNLATITNAQQMADLHQAMASQYTPVPLVGLDRKPLVMPNGTPVTLPSMHANTWYQAQVAAASRVQAAQIQAGPTVNTPQDQQDQLGMPATTSLRSANQGAGLLQKQAGLVPVDDQMRKMLGLPQSVQSVPTSSLMRAMTMMQPQTKSSFEWKETSPGTWEPLPTTSVTTRGAPGASGGAGGARTNKIYGGGSIYAYDPKTNDTVMTTPQEAQTNGYTNPRKVSQTNIENDRQLNNRLYDVAAKVQRYEQSINQPISDLDRTKLADLLGSDKLQFGAFGAHLPTDWIDQLTKAASTAGLSAAAQQRLINYYNVREAMTGYTRVLTGSGRSNETNLNLNLQAMPSPIQPDNFTKQGISQFKQNIGIAGQGLPKMPGIQRAQDIMGPQGEAPSGPSVRVKLPDGRTGTIPASSLKKYTGMGATVMQ